MNHVCDQCGDRFERDGGRTYRYCSRLCFHASRIDRPRVKLDQVERTCGWCGRDFRSVPSAGAKQRFCSRSCQGYASTKHPPCRLLSIAEAAYLAGLVDGEGTILTMDRRSTRPNASRPTICVSIAGCHLPMLEWVRETTGTGSVRRATESRSPIVKSSQICYYWRCTSIAALTLLTQIEPFMIEKQDRANVAIRSQPAEALQPACQPAAY